MRFSLNKNLVCEEKNLILHRGTIKNCIENLENFKEFFIQTIEKINLENTENKYNSLKLIYKTQYHEYTIEACFDINNVFVIKITDYENDDLSTKTINIYLNIQKKIRFPNSIFKNYYNNSEKMIRNLDFMKEILDIFNERKIFIDYESLASIPFRFADPLGFWLGNIYDFNDSNKFKIHFLYKS